MATQARQIIRLCKLSILSVFVTMMTPESPESPVPLFHFASPTAPLSFSSSFRLALWGRKLDALLEELLWVGNNNKPVENVRKAPETVLSDEDNYFEPADKEKTRVFAFGCKMYKWLTGNELFQVDGGATWNRADHLWRIWFFNTALFPRWMCKLAPFGQTLLTPAGEIACHPSCQIVALPIRRMFPVSVPKWASRCIHECTRIDPHKRPTFSMVREMLFTEMQRLPFGTLLSSWRHRHGLRMHDEGDATRAVRVACACTHLVLDLDNVLIAEAPFDEEGVFVLQNNHSNPRPLVFEFLRCCFRLFHTVSLWTAGTKEWLKTFTQFLADHRMSPETNARNARCTIDTDVFSDTSTTFLFEYSRDQCPQDGIDRLTKPLEKMWNTETARRVGMGPHNTIIVDDCARNGASNKENVLLAHEFVFRAGPRCETMVELAARIVQLAVTMYQKRPAQPQNMDDKKNNTANPILSAQEQLPTDQKNVRCGEVNVGVFV